MNFLCANNQGGKSSVQIIKAIIWATDKSLWPGLWRITPNMFWYLYPDFNTANVEFETKWKKYLPKNEYKDHPVYGWTEKYYQGKIHSITFNSGVIIYFRTYNQDVQNIQASTVFACFTKGHQILTNKGNKNIEDIKIGDYVLTRNGYNKVINTMSRFAKTYKAKFSNGEVLVGTADHPVFTLNRGWVEIQALTVKDVCVTIPAWINEIQQKKNLLFLRMRCIGAIVYQKTIENVIILGLQKVSLYILKFGSLLIEKIYQMVFVSTTLISTHLITVLKILNLLLEKNTPEYIKNVSGKIKKHTHIFVKYVGKNLYQEHLKKLFRAIVLKNVVKTTIIKTKKLMTQINHLLKYVLFVKKNLSQKIFIKMARRVHVLAVPILYGQKEEVFNLTVEETPEYFVNNILVHNCFTDEELYPSSTYDELSARMFATDGYFHMAFTATSGQEDWRRVMEEQGTDKELFPKAFKQTVSMYDCLYYEDGTPSDVFTESTIAAIINKCKSEAEVQRRVFGRFVLDTGLIYESFDPKKNIVKPYDIPKDWSIFVGIDIGSGGRNHPAAISFVAVRPDFKKAALFNCWRGDDVITTNADILIQYVEMKKGLDITGAFFDWSSTDFGSIAASAEVPIMKADKSHEVGEGLLNVLWKNQMLDIFDIPESWKLVNEAKGLKIGTPKNKCVDDLLDSLRYALSKITFDFSDIEKNRIIRVNVPEKDPIQKRGEFFNEEEKDREFEEWNEYYEV